MKLDGGGEIVAGGREPLLAGGMKLAGGELLGDGA
jgi:hypothetical protein